MTAPTTTSTKRRRRVSRGFGRMPRFVLANSELAARLIVVRLERAA